MRRLIQTVLLGALCCVLPTRATAQSGVPLRFELPSYASEELLKFAGYYTLAEHHAVVISYRTMDGGASPVLMLTDLKTDAVRALFEGGADRFTIGPELTRPEPVVAEIRFTRSESGEGMELEFAPVGGAPLKGSRIAIKTKDIEYEYDGLTFGATLFTPPGDGPAPGALLVTGSGSDDADRYSHDALPWALASRGFVVLAYDKRGVGTSGGTHRISMEARADDGAAALRALRSQPRVDQDRVGVFGYSEGAWLCPMIARRDANVAFLVAISGGGGIKADGILWRMRNEFIETGMSGEALEQAVDRQRVRLVEESRQRVDAGEATDFDLRLLYDPTDDWKAYDGSVLTLLGAWDMLVDSRRCAAWLRATLPESGSRDWEVNVFPMAHHPMFRGTTGLHSEFATMRGISHFVPGYWPTLLHWLDERYGD